MIYFTSDLHLGHDKDFIYERRGFKNIDEMNNTLIKNWNNTVTSEDEVYILGDVMLGPEQNLSMVKSLVGRKHIIAGNHDTDQRIEMYRNCWDIVGVKHADRIRYGKYCFYLSHYPTMVCPDDTKRMDRIIICLHGHTHFTDKFYNDMCYCYNVGVDAHDFKPVSIEEIIEDIKYKKQHGKREI